jgi:hypothetical protein
VISEAGNENEIVVFVLECEYAWARVVTITEWNEMLNRVLAS